MEHRVIKSNEVGVISKDGLEWIGASKIEYECDECGKVDVPMYFQWRLPDTNWCGACLIQDWEDNLPDESEN